MDYTVGLRRIEDEKPLYMKWTASIVQPEIFSDYDIRTEISDFYKDYYGYESVMSSWTAF